MHACVACESKRKKKRDACLVCSLCLSGCMGVFSEDAGRLAFFVSRSPSGVEKDGKLCEAPRNHKVRGRARRKARVPVVVTVHEMWLLRDWVQGGSATTAASKRARRCSASAACCVKKRRLSSGDTRVSHRGNFACVSIRSVYSPQICMICHFQYHFEATLDFVVELMVIPWALIVFR